MAAHITVIAGLGKFALAASLSSIVNALILLSLTPLPNAGQLLLPVGALAVLANFAVAGAWLRRGQYAAFAGVFSGCLAAPLAVASQAWSWPDVFLRGVIYLLLHQG